ncbi:MAG: tail fiber domain-containing protein [Cyclobacteriaceae bacterium]|nr:tail fiber domain-containing protein [Cyclobacteriaceae bacterium]
MKRIGKDPSAMIKIIVFALSLLSSFSGWSQGLGLGTNSPSEILHLYRDQNTIPGDVTIRYQTQAAGTGAIVSEPLSGVSSNMAGVGTIAWTNPINADATDDTYTTATLGTSNYLYSDVSFVIPGGATINSIDIEVEKSYTNNPTAILDAWTIGNINTISYTASAGTDRILIVAISQTNRNGTVETMGSISFGGQALTKINNTTQLDNDDSSLEVWYLNEAGIVAAGAGAQTLDMSNWSVSGDIEDEIYAVATYQYVDQTNPISASESAVSGVEKVASIQLVTPVAVNTGDIMLAIGAQADNRSFDVVPAGYSELFDVTHNDNRGSTLAVNEKSITTSGTEQPTVTGQAGNLEGMHISGVVINNGFGNTTDNVVSLYSGGALIGANLASGTAWTITDTYASYAGVATEVQINAADFGLVVSATVTGRFCTAQIDHVRISVTYTTTPSVFTDFASGLDLSTGNYVISQSSALGTSDIMRMNTGAITFSVAAGTFSDRRFKQNIEQLNGTLEKLKKISGVYYDMRVEQFPSMSFTKSRQIGFIAQDLEKVYPELVKTDEQGFKSVTYATMTPILVEAIKELNKKIENLERENKELTAELKAFEYLEQEVLEMKKILNTISIKSSGTATVKK